MSPGSVRRSAAWIESHQRARSSLRDQRMGGHRSSLSVTVRTANCGRDASHSSYEMCQQWELPITPTFRSTSYTEVSRSPIVVGPVKGVTPKHSPVGSLFNIVRQTRVHEHAVPTKASRLIRQSRAWEHAQTPPGR
jgi:hypothetical protein